MIFLAGMRKVGYTCRINERASAVILTPPRRDTMEVPTVQIQSSPLPGAQQTKHCTSCDQDLPLDSFHRNKRSPDGHVSICKECARLKVRSWYCANRDRARESAARKYAENRQANIERAARWAAANRQRRREINRDYDARNPLLRKNRAAKPRATMTGEELARAREMGRYHHALHRSGERQADGCLTFDQWLGILLRAGGICVYCGSRAVSTMDHCIPVERGGKTAQGNLIPACRSCNNSKGGGDLLEWVQRRFGAAGLARVRAFLGDSTG